MLHLLLISTSFLVDLVQIFSILSYRLMLILHRIYPIKIEFSTSSLAVIEFWENLYEIDKWNLQNFVKFKCFFFLNFMEHDVIRIRTITYNKVYLSCICRNSNPSLTKILQLHSKWKNKYEQFPISTIICGRINRKGTKTFSFHKIEEKKEEKWRKNTHKSTIILMMTISARTEIKFYRNKTQFFFSSNVLNSNKKRTQIAAN